MTTRSRSKVLLVDDSSLHRTLATEMLSRAGIDVVALRSPMGFSLALHEHRPDLALVDVTMPAFNGDQMVKGAKSSLRDLCPIVFYSGRPEKELAELAKRCGVAGYICKSSDWDGIAAAVRSFLARSAAAAAGPRR